METFKKLFQGKKKNITIPLFFVLSIIFFPISIGLSFIWLIVKRIKNQKIKKVFLAVISFSALLVGGGWIDGILQPKSEEMPSIIPTLTQITSGEPYPTQVLEQIGGTVFDSKQEVKVTRAVDGDTIEVLIEGKVEKVRLIGVNTPETVDPRKMVECFGQEAAKITKDKLVDQIVWLESDSTQGDRDKYSRLLRYVWTNDGVIDFGKALIETGYAYEYTYGKPYKYQLFYKEAQLAAERGKKGLWSDDACLVTPTVDKLTISPTKILTLEAVMGSSTASESCKYSCFGPDRDCSDFSSQTEAQAFFGCCGFTAEYDPMKLDSPDVGNGIVCESI